jgi:hypothetical protein
MTRHLGQGGRFSRVADPAWADPLDPSYARRQGGRWNPPQSFGVVYLCADMATARANVARLFAGFPYGPEDLDPDRAPQLVEVDLPKESYVDAVSEAGLRSLKLLVSYPVEPDGKTVPHHICQPIGQRLYDAGELGIASRSAAPGAAHGRELAWFAQPGRPALATHSRRTFESWFWG